jgi:WXG100 family type VII secretion target
MAADKVGASPQAMQEAVTNFNNRYSEFVDAQQQISDDTLALQANWQGRGYDEFTGAMGSWNIDIGKVLQDLQSMSLGVQQSCDAIQHGDNNIALAFRGYQQ